MNYLGALSVILCLEDLILDVLDDRTVTIVTLSHLGLGRWSKTSHDHVLDHVWLQNGGEEPEAQGSDLGMEANQCSGKKAPSSVVRVKANKSWTHASPSLPTSSGSSLGDLKGFLFRKWKEVWKGVQKNTAKPSGILDQLNRFSSKAPQSALEEDFKVRFQVQWEGFCQDFPWLYAYIPP